MCVWCRIECLHKYQMQWCKTRCHWTLEPWIWWINSTESHFSFWQSDRQVWVWQTELSDWIVPSLRFGGGRMMVWGCFSRSWTWPLSSSERNSLCFSIQTLCGNILRIIISSFRLSFFFFCITRQTIWSIPLAYYVNVNMMCGYVLWKSGQLCLAENIRVKVQAALERRYMQCRLKHRAV